MLSGTGYLMCMGISQHLHLGGKTGDGIEKIALHDPNIDIKDQI